MSRSSSNSSILADHTIVSNFSSSMDNYSNFSIPNFSQFYSLQEQNY